MLRATFPSGLPLALGVGPCPQKCLVCPWRDEPLSRAKEAKRCEMEKTLLIREFSLGTGNACANKGATARPHISENKKEK